MKKILNNIGLIFLLTIGYVNAQDPLFTQFYNNPVYYNPGQIALNNGYSAKFHARNQWGPIPGKFNTIHASFEAVMIPKLAFAVNAFSDVAGQANLRSTGGYMHYAYRPVETRNLIFQLGVCGGIINRSVDWSKLVFSDQLHPTQGDGGQSAFMSPDRRSFTYADFGAGFSLRFNHEASKYGKGYKKMMVTIGGSAMHLSMPRDAFFASDVLPVKFVGNAQVAMLFGETVIAPSLIYENQRKFQTANIGLHLFRGPMIFGAHVRNEVMYYDPKRFESLLFSLGVRLPMSDERQLKIMYSVDFTTSKLRSSSFGSHEISLVMDWNDRFLLEKNYKKRSKKKQYQCPKDLGGL